MTFTQEDRDLLMQKGISESQIEEQLSCFKTGFPFLKLKSPASIGNGILSLNEKESEHYLEIWENTCREIRLSSNLFRLRVLQAGCLKICSNF